MVNGGVSKRRTYDVGVPNRQISHNLVRWRNEIINLGPDEKITWFESTLRSMLFLGRRVMGDLINGAVRHHIKYVDHPQEPNKIGLFNRTSSNLVLTAWLNDDKSEGDLPERLVRLRPSK